MPNTPYRTAGANNESGDDSPQWWNPRWTVGMACFFVVFVVGLFIACRYWVGHPNDTPAFVSGVIGMLTLYAIVVQVAINRHQWKAMQEALRQNREHFELTERPIVVVQEAHGVFRLESGGNVVIPTITLKNKGRMGAKDILVIFEARIGSYATYPNHTGVGVVAELLTPDDESEINNPKTLPTYSLSLDGDVWKAIESGDETLFIYGKGRYYDMRMQRVSRFDILPFVFKYNPPTKMFIRDYGIPNEWKIEANFREPAPWRPKSGLSLRQTLPITAEEKEDK